MPMRDLNISEDIGMPNGAFLAVTEIYKNAIKAKIQPLEKSRVRSFLVSMTSCKIKHDFE